MAGERERDRHRGGGVYCPINGRQPCIFLDRAVHFPSSPPADLRPSNPIREGIRTEKMSQALQTRPPTGPLKASFFASVRCLLAGRGVCGACCA